MYPALPKSYKAMFPFKIATTSFIYPDGYIANVRMLGPFVDEIELLVFESAPVKSLFCAPVIDELVELSGRLEISYNVHLPTDISISDPDPRRQQQAVETLIEIIERLSPLSPSSYTLHVPFNRDDDNPETVAKWRRRVDRNLRKIVAAGIFADKIAIENLDYPFELIGPIVSGLGLSVCLDAGHLMIAGQEVNSLFAPWADAVSIIHLHGVEALRDHLPLDRLGPARITPLIEILQNFNGCVSLEVFSLPHLRSSLEFLATHWAKRNRGSAENRADRIIY